MARLNEDDNFYGGYEGPCFLDSKDFKAYTARIREIIFAAEDPVSIRTIHRKLGDAARIDWTADALASIRGIEPVGVLPTRYRPAPDPPLFA